MHEDGPRAWEGELRRLVVRVGGSFSERRRQLECVLTVQTTFSGRMKKMR